MACCSFYSNGHFDLLMNIQASSKVLCLKDHVHVCQYNSHAWQSPKFIDMKQLDSIVTALSLVEAPAAACSWCQSLSLTLLLSSLMNLPWNTLEIKWRNQADDNSNRSPMAFDVATMDLLIRLVETAELTKSWSILETITLESHESYQIWILNSNPHMIWDWGNEGEEHKTNTQTGRKRKRCALTDYECLGGPLTYQHAHWMRSLNQFECLSSMMSWIDMMYWVMNGSCAKWGWTKVPSDAEPQRGEKP